MEEDFWQQVRGGSQTVGTRLAEASAGQETVENLDEASLRAAPQALVGRIVNDG